MEILAGPIPRRALALVLEWAQLHRAELATDRERAIDLAPSLRGQVFAPHRTDPAFFGTVSVDPEAGTIGWPDGTDLDPDVLRWGLRPASWQAAPGRD